MKKFIKNILNTVLNKTGLRRVVYVYSNDKNYILPNHPVEGKLRGQNAFVTGANGAIGRAITAVLISHGAKVFAVGRNKEKLLLLEKEMNRLYPGSCQMCVADLENETELSEAVGHSVGAGNVDIWVNCAGGSAREKAKPLIEQDMNIIDRVLDSNIRTCIIGCKIAATRMTKQQSGSIINIASSIVERGIANFSEYTASKSAVIGFSKNLALELGASGIRVNCISPSYIQRGEYDSNKRNHLLQTSCLQRVGTPEDIAHAVAFMASHEAGFITAQNLLVDGGRCLGVQGK